MNKKIRIKEYFKLSIKDTFVTFGIFAVAFILCCILIKIDDVGGFVNILFLLAVFLISLITKGFFYGVSSSFLSVLLINYFFTYPYYKFNFTLSGYPLTILCSLIVAVLTSVLTTKVKEHSIIMIEAEKEKTRGNLLRAISHDLRTPLTSIIGASTAIRDNYDNLSKESKLELLSEISDDAGYLIRMVENLLSITRFDESGYAEISKVPEVVDEIIEGSIAKFKKHFPNYKITVNMPSEFIMVSMDAMLIEQVIVNLLENSVTHAKGADKIEFSVKKEENFAIFEVSDNGEGINEKLLPNIFNALSENSSSSENDNKKNMGIGLSVCNTIIKAHNGTMSAQNKPSGGAVFRFSLPLEEA